ncbi:resolvase [Methylobacterium sp. Leaf90]|nr:resolvase [Methylobacterium sp. Leaf90]
MPEDILPREGSPLQLLIRNRIDRRTDLPGPTQQTPSVIAYYLRRSSADPLYFSIAAQLAHCNAHSHSLGGEFDQRRLLFVDRHRSGATTIGREGIAAMLEAARQGRFRILVVRSICRLTRNATDAARLHEQLTGLGVSIHVAGRGQVQQYEIMLLALSAQRERLRMMASLMDGKRRAAVGGEFFGSWPTYGYDRIDGPDWRKNVNQAAILERCFREVDAGLNLQDLAKLLNGECIPARNGGIWRPRHFFARGRGLLDRPILKGVFVWSLWGEKPITISRPDLAVISADLFDRVNERYGVPTRTQEPRTRAPFLLGLVRCACGDRMHLAEDGNAMHLHCRTAQIGGGCDRTKGFSTSIVARQVLHLFRHEILDPDSGPELEEGRRIEWQGLNATVQAERDRVSARIEQIAHELDALSQDEEEIDPYAAAACCELELEHHKLSERLTQLVVPPFGALDWERVDVDRARILRVMERLPSMSRSGEDLRVIELVRSIVSEIELDIREDGYQLRVWFGAPGAPKGFDAVDRLAGRWWMRWFPMPPKGPLRYPEVVLGHQRRAEAGMFRLDDGDWAAVEPVIRNAPRLGPRDRTMAEAILFIGMTGLPAKYFPERYEPCAPLLKHARPGAVWRGMYEVLHQRCSPVVAEAGPAARILHEDLNSRAHAHPVPPLEDPSPWCDPKA